MLEIPKSSHDQFLSYLNYRTYTVDQYPKVYQFMDVTIITDEHVYLIRISKFGFRIISTIFWQQHLYDYS